MKLFELFVLRPAIDEPLLAMSNNEVLEEKKRCSMYVCFPSFIALGLCGKPKMEVRVPVLWEKNTLSF